MDSLILLRSIDIPLNWSSRSSRFLGEERRKQGKEKKGGETKKRKEKEEEEKRTMKIEKREGNETEKKTRIKRQIMASIHHTSSKTFLFTATCMAQTKSA